MKFLIKMFLLCSVFTLANCQTSEKSKDGVVEITVDQTGYHPENIEVPKGQDSVILRFKRVTDHTCAREVVSEGQSINKELPLKKAVEIRFDLKGKKEVVYGCHMDKMHKGVITVK